MIPANGSALLTKAGPGAELACRAHEKQFAEGDAHVPRGVISWYAAMTLPLATDLDSWLRNIDGASRRDVESGDINSFDRPHLEIFGDFRQTLPGRPEKFEI